MSQRISLISSLLHVGKTHIHVHTHSHVHSGHNVATGVAGDIYLPNLTSQIGLRLYLPLCTMKSMWYLMFENAF